jgi:anti-sigma B factor antagonist
MTINKTINGNQAVYAVSGRLETITAPELEEALKTGLDGIAGLTLDFTELDYISSAGLRVVLFAQKKMMAAGGKMKILNPNEIVSEIFDVTGFSDILDIEKA